MRLKDKIAIITGGGKGIGRAVAEAFTAEGASVAITDVDAAALQSAADALCGDVVILENDVSDIDSHTQLLDTVVNIWGRIDVLVNNAGIEISQPILEASPDAWDKLFGTNLRGPFFLAQRVAKQMIASGNKGCIVNIASVHDQTPLWESGVYSITKAGMGMVTKTLALELAPFGIRVNSVSPGAIATPMNQPLLSDPEKLAQTEKTIPLGRIGLPREVARAAVFLASDEASYVTGATLYVDGGLLLRT